MRRASHDKRDTRHATLARHPQRATLTVDIATPSERATCRAAPSRSRHTRAARSIAISLAPPPSAAKTPAVVLACAILGVDKDLRDIADEFAATGGILVASDLFGRSLAGAARRYEESARAGARATGGRRRSRPGRGRHEGRAGAHPQSAAVQRPRRGDGICYGGPYAILGPKRWATMPACRATARSCSRSSASSTASLRRSASGGAIRITSHRSPCSTPTARCR